MGLFPNYVNTGFTMGDWVVYEKDGEKKTGRVAHPTFSGDLHVCFTQGCEADVVNHEYVRAATTEEIRRMPTDIGHNRFRGICRDRPDYNDKNGPCWFCSSVNPDKKKESEDEQIAD